MKKVNVDVFANTVGNVMTADKITVGSPPAEQTSARDRIKVLFVAANPRHTTQLALDEEARAIDQKLRMSEHRDAMQVVTAWATRPDDLMQQLYQHRPTIVHISGHGTSDGAIVLVDSRGEPRPVSAAALEALFAAMKDNIRIVFLNACYSRVQAEAISGNIDFVIGMNVAIGDDAAIVFAAAFYRAIGFGRTVGEAFGQARIAVMLDGLPEADTPVLFVRTGASAQQVLL